VSARCLKFWRRCGAAVKGPGFDFGNRGSTPRVDIGFFFAFFSRCLDGLSRCVVRCFGAAVARRLKGRGSTLATAVRLREWT